MENTKKIHDLLMNAIFEVFEKMFFVFLEPADEEISYEMISSIEFLGPVKGDIRVYFSYGVAETMVRNMLGIDNSEITDRLIEDCTKEAVNMISGNFLHKYDSSKVFDLSIPEFEKKKSTFASQENKADKTVWNLVFESEGGMMALRLNFRQ